MRRADRLSDTTGACEAEQQPISLTAYRILSAIGDNPRRGSEAHIMPDNLSILVAFVVFFAADAM